MAKKELIKSEMHEVLEIVENELEINDYKTSIDCSSEMNELYVAELAVCGKEIIDKLSVLYKKYNPSLCLS